MYIDYDHDGNKGNSNQQESSKSIYQPYHRHIIECQKRKEKGNEEYRNGNYERASFEYKIGLSYIREYEKDILEKDGDNDCGNNKENMDEKIKVTIPYWIWYKGTKKRNH